MLQSLTFRSIGYRFLLIGFFEGIIFLKGSLVLYVSIFFGYKICMFDSKGRNTVSILFHEWT